MKTIAIPITDEPIEEHTDTDLFCGDMPCPYHEDAENVAIVGQQVQDGLMTPTEADQYYRNQHV